MRVLPWDAMHEPVAVGAHVCGCSQQDAPPGSGTSKLHVRGCAPAGEAVSRAWAEMQASPTAACLLAVGLPR